MATGSWICLCSVLLLLSLLPTKTNAQDQTDNSTGSSCVVNFLTQPPTNLPCNPYDPSFNRLRLQCDVAMLHGSSNLRVRWYRLQHRDGQPERVLDRNNPTSVSFRRRFLNDQLLMTSWLHLRNVTEEDIGTYWCQLDDGDELAVVHKPCTVTHLEEAVRYSDLTACTWAFFFSLGPVCVHPYNECSSEPIENQPSPSPVPTSSRHVVRESTNPSTAPGNTASDMFFWFIPVIAVSLIVLIILGAVVLATAVILKKRCTKTSITPASPTVHVQNLQDQLPHSQNQSNPPLHSSVMKRMSSDSDYDTPEQLQRPVHSQQYQSDSTWSDHQIDTIYGSIDSQASGLGEQETKEARRHLQTVERDGNSYLIISRSPTSTSDELVDYTVPSMAMQSVNTDRCTKTESVVMAQDLESEFEVSYHTYENEPPPRYAPLRSDTLDQARMYSLPMSKKCQMAQGLPTTISTVSENPTCFVIK